MEILKNLGLDGKIRNVKQNLFIMNLLFRGLLKKVHCTVMIQNIKGFFILSLPSLSMHTDLICRFY
jgi:hypothetical protein